MSKSQVSKTISLLGQPLPKDEFANVLTHGFGALLCLFFIPVLLYEGLEKGDKDLTIGLAIFGTSLFFVYLTSTLYHIVQNARLKHKLRIVDHISIYFLIAGTHTPFLLYYLNNDTGRFYLTLLWSLVFIGTIYKLFFFGKLRLISVFFYAGMGWMAIFTIPPMFGVLDPQALWWIVIGGISYTLGIIFFLWEKLPYHHAIWHLFVMGGSFGHFMALWSVVIS